MSNKEKNSKGKKAAEIAGKVTKIALTVAAILLGRKWLGGGNNSGQQGA